MADTALHASTTTAENIAGTATATTTKNRHDGTGLGRQLPGVARVQ